MEKVVINILWIISFVLIALGLIKFLVGVYQDVKYQDSAEQTLDNMKGFEKDFKGLATKGMKYLVVGILLLIALFNQ